MRNRLTALFALAWIVSVPCLYAAYNANQAQYPGYKPLQNQQRQGTPNQKFSASDYQLKSRIQQKLDSFPWDTNNILIEVDEGKVTLRGKVETIEELELIEENLSDIRGITLIDTQIEIEPTQTNYRWNNRDYNNRFQR